MPYKDTKTYEAEAERIGKCLVHPVYGIPRKLWQRRHNTVLPPHLCVCHTCDNGYCIRDNHHFIGTQKANMLDAQMKGRLQRSAKQRAAYSAGALKRWGQKGSKERRKLSSTVRNMHRNDETFRANFLASQHSKAYRESQAERCRLRWEDPKFRAIMCAKNKAVWRRKGRKAFMSERARLGWAKRRKSK